MSSSEGRESPPPESQTSAQVGEPSSGKGLGNGPEQSQEHDDQLKNLTSNPKGPLDDIVKEKFKKTVDISK